MGVEIVEYTDPGCSWAWGTEPKLRLLRWRYEDRVTWRRVMGGLVEDAGRRPGFDPAAAAPKTSVYWSRVTEHTGMPYPVDLKYVGRTTVIGCRAVKAAERQGEEVAQRVLRRLRESTFVFCTPADTVERAIDAVNGVTGLSAGQLRDDLDSEQVEAAYQKDWLETRRPNQYVLELEDDYTGNGRAKEDGDHKRYAFPTILFRGP